jgi:Tetratricopeptide repeat
VDQQSGHLSNAEIERYGEMAVSPEPKAEDRPDRVEAHLSDCPACRGRVLSSQRARLALLAATPVTTAPNADRPAPGRPGSDGADRSHRGPDCPDEDNFRQLAAGLCPTNQATQLTQHAAQCDHCGPLLRAFTEDFSDELSKEDAAVLGKLKSSSGGWQKKLAREMLVKDSAAFERKSEKKARSWIWALAPSAVVIAVAVWVWFLPIWTAKHTNDVIVIEYKKGRPMAYRPADVPFGPVRVAMGSSESLPEVSIPDGQQFPVPAANAAFLNRDPDLARSILEQARDRGGDSIPVLDDLAVAYAMEADRSGRKEDYEKALRTCDKVLSKNPSDATAYFNRALILEQLGRREDAIAALQRFLTIENDPDWIASAKKILQALS